MKSHRISLTYRQEIKNGLEMIAEKTGKTEREIVLSAIHSLCEEVKTKGIEGVGLSDVSIKDKKRVRFPIDFDTAELLKIAEEKTKIKANDFIHTAIRNLIDYVKKNGYPTKIETEDTIVDNSSYTSYGRICERYNNAARPNEELAEDWVKNTELLAKYSRAITDDLLTMTYLRMSKDYSREKTFYEQLKHAISNTYADLLYSRQRTKVFESNYLSAESEDIITQKYHNKCAEKC